jgi:His-Xaa-Ser system protein HxsD
MSKESEINSYTNENFIEFRLSEHIFSIEAARATAYKYTDRFFISIEPETEEFYRVKLQLKNLINTFDLSVLSSEFKNEMLDQQIRIDLANRFGSLRETIVNCAFKPIDSIGDKNGSK